MKAITLREPWALLTCEFEKSPISVAEPIDYRGPLAIHAACRRALPVDDVTMQVARVYGKSYMTAFLYAASRQVPLGVILAVGELIDCVPAQTIKVSHRHDPGTPRNLRRGDPPLRKRDLVGTPLDNHAGRFMLIVEGLRMIDPPVDWRRGGRGLWTAPDDLVARLAA